MFYDKFVVLCNSKGKSPTAVAKEIGLAGAHVTKWKKGSTPTDATTYKICNYFGLPHDYFKNDKAFSVENKKSPAPEGAELSEFHKKAWELIEEMDDETLEKFIASAVIWLKQ